MHCGLDMYCFVLSLIIDALQSSKKLMASIQDHLFARISEYFNNMV